MGWPTVALIVSIFGTLVAAWTSIRVSRNKNSGPDKSNQEFREAMIRSTTQIETNQTNLYKLVRKLEKRFDDYINSH